MLIDIDQEWRDENKNRSLSLAGGKNPDFSMSRSRNADLSMTRSGNVQTSAVLDQTDKSLFHKYVLR